jgi:hypothetical protein
MTTRTLRFLALSLTALLVSPLTSEADQWQWPLARHQLSERFDFDRSDPYRAGARRGITLSGQPGAKVRAVCSGVVSFAGPLPDGRRGVTLRCGGLAATELGLQQSEVSGGETVIAGQPLGSLGPGALLSVGARLIDERNGYRDPLALLAAPPHGESVETVFVIGGGTVYEAALAHAGCVGVHLTRGDSDAPCDTFFPALDPSVWRLWGTAPPMADGGVRYQFEAWVRAGAKGPPGGAWPPAARPAHGEEQVGW